MNASALLQSQGWRGEGHTLHATSDSIGLKNRLLVSRKANTSGLGASEYANDQWWLSALDEQLGGLSTKNGKVVQTVKDGKLNRLNENVGKPELYKFFVSGGLLQGTVDKLPTGTGDAASHDKPALKTKVVALTASAKQSETESTSSSSESSKRNESKEGRRARKAARRERRKQKRARREARKQKARSTSSADADEGTDGAKSAKSETKEERRARKEARRKQKEEKRRLRH